jgi:hypothetical protein
LQATEQRKFQIPEEKRSKTLLKAKNESANTVVVHLVQSFYISIHFITYRVAIMYKTGNIFDHYFWGGTSAHEGRIIYKNIKFGLGA